MTLYTTAEQLYDKLKRIAVDNPLCTYTLERCERLAPLIDRILVLKKEKDALILAHSYVHPDIIYGVADHTGDSYGLAKNARDAENQVIVFSSVRFMVETAKILNPEKTVIDPNPNGGCTLADSICADDVYRLREKYPHHTFVCYINTTAAIKAACDVCVTSSNIYTILERLPTDRIFFLPDRLMGENAQQWLRSKKIDKEILLWDGVCYVHEQFEAAELSLLKQQHPESIVLAHPECKPEVISMADVVGSTTQMHNYITARPNEKRPFLLLTECGVASRLNVEAPNARLVGGCMLCKYMRSNSLYAIEQALRAPTPAQIVELDPAVIQGARLCIERMFQYAE